MRWRHIAKREVIGGKLTLAAVVVFVYVLVAVSGCASHARAKLVFGCNGGYEVEEKSKTHTQSLQDGDWRHGRVAAHSMRPGAAGRYDARRQLGDDPSVAVEYASDAPGECTSAHVLLSGSDNRR